MLWDIIRDWFVMYIWGGVASSGNHYGGLAGSFIFHNQDGEELLDLTTDLIGLPVDLFSYDHGVADSVYISLGDWLSTMSTIITLVLLVIMLLTLVRYIVRQVSGLFTKI